MKTQIASKFIPLIALFAVTICTTGCFSLRDEYAFMASQYIRSSNQMPYVQAVKSIDAQSSPGYGTYSYCTPCVIRRELPAEQGSILLTTPSGS